MKTSASSCLFFAVSTGSEEIYGCAWGILASLSWLQNLSYEQIKAHVSRLSGVTPISMICVELLPCLYWPFADHDVCAFCSEPRYDPHVLAQSGGTKKGTPAWVSDYSYRPISSGTEGLPTEFRDLSYGKNVTEEILKEWTENDGDACHLQGCFLGQWLSGCCERWWYFYDDMCLMFSLTLHSSMKEEVRLLHLHLLLLDRPPHQRYKKKYVLPLGQLFRPKSFQKSWFLHFPWPLPPCSYPEWRGFMIWDALLHSEHFAVIHFCSLSLQIPQLCRYWWDGWPWWKHGCRRHCGFTGRHKHNESPLYYAAQKPDNSTLRCDHPWLELFWQYASFTAVNAQR